MSLTPKQLAQLIFVFAFVGTGAGCVWQLGPEGGDARWSVFAGITIGAVATFEVWRSIQDRTANRPPKPPPTPIFSGIVALGGAVIVIMGIAAGSSNLMLAGLPLLALGAVMIGITEWQRRR